MVFWDWNLFWYINMAERGRPSLYSEALVDEICDKIATSNKGLHAICKDNDYPAVVTLMNWLNDPDKVYFLNKYVRARELQADFMAQEILDIADETEHDTIHHEKFGDMPNNEWINRSRLRVDSRKWLMSKLLPKKYGDKLDVTSDGKELKTTIINLGSGVKPDEAAD